MAGRRWPYDHHANSAVEAMVSAAHKHLGNQFRLMVLEPYSGVSQFITPGPSRALPSQLDNVGPVEGGPDSDASEDYELSSEDSEMNQAEAEPQGSDLGGRQAAACQSCAATRQQLAQLTEDVRGLLVERETMLNKLNDLTKTVREQKMALRSAGVVPRKSAGSSKSRH